MLRLAIEIMWSYSNCRRHRGSREQACVVLRVARSQTLDATESGGRTRVLCMKPFNSIDLLRKIRVKSASGSQSERQRHRSTDSRSGTTTITISVRSYIAQVDDWVGPGTRGSRGR